MHDERKTKARLILELKTIREQAKRYQAASRKAAEIATAFRESEAEYRSLFENNVDAVLLTSPDGGILEANSVACRIFGRSVRELRLLGRRAVVDASDPRLAAASRNAIGQGSLKAN